MPKELRFSQQKLDEVNKLIKGGYSEDDAFNRAGITEEEYGLYQLDDKGRVTKAFDTIEVRTKEEEEARYAEDQRRIQEQEAARERRNEEIKADRERNLERLRKKREEEKLAAKKGWSDEEDKAETTGPAATRGEVTTTVTGGGSRETRMTAEMSNWTDKNNQAYKADDKATQEAKNEYLRSLGLENANFREKNKALRAAEAEGKNFNVTTNRDALGPPPANQYEEITIRPNADGKQVPNDGSQTTNQAAKNQADGQTAEDKLINDNLPPQPGAGSTATNQTNDPNPYLVPAATVSVAEADKIRNNENKASAAEELPPNAFPAPAGSESKSVEAGKNLEQRKQDSIKGTTSTSKPTDTGKTDSDKQKELSLKLAKAKKNALHDYASSTYRITLYLMSALDYSEMIERPSSFVPKFVLISSGGGYPEIQPLKDAATAKKSGRHPDFMEDFFIENLSVTTVVGLNAKTKASNAIEISFTIVEPYGMTLLDRLQSACMMPPVNSPNYIDQPYLLEIDFISNVDEAKGVSNKIDRKRVAIKIIEMKIKPGTGGTEYRCRAMPYNHSAFQDSMAALPVALSVQAGTVGEFFDSNTEIAKIFSPEVAQNEERVESELQKWAAEQTEKNSGTKPTPAEITEERDRIRAQYSYTTKSYPAGFNTFMRGVSGSGKTFKLPPALIAFNIEDSRIQKSKIVDEKFAEARTVPMTDPKESYKTSVVAKLTEGKTKQGFNINPGINIVQLIDRVMQASEYISGQVKEAKEAIARNQAIITDRSNLLNDPQQTQAEKEQRFRELREAEAELNKYKFLDWYKIVPQVYLNGFDDSANAYSKTAVYTIVPYKAANAYHPDFAKTRINKSKIVRSYNYLYTGLNQDIVGIEIDFDSLYFTSITAYQDSKTATAASFSNPTENEDNVQRDVDPNQSNPRRNLNPPSSYKPVGVNAKGQGQLNRAVKPDAAAVSDIADSIYTSSRGDMLNVQLRIIGDPAFIKQDDIYYNPMSPDYKNTVISKSSGENNSETVPINPDTGQIIFDQEQVFVQLIVKSAVDIDDATGITNKQIKLSNGKMTDSTFSGVYKVLKVKSDFSRGKFEQTLDLVKMPNDLFYDDTPPISPKVELQATVAATESTFVTAPAPVQENPTTDNTGLNTTQLADLKNAAAQPTTNPTSVASGAGTVATAPQPTAAAPSNAGDAPAIAPQEKAPPDPRLALDEFEAEYNDLVRDRAAQIPVFNAELARIRNDNTLSAAEKAEKVISLRQGLQETLRAQADQIVQLATKTYKTNTEIGSDAGLDKLKLLTKLSRLQKETTEFFQAQTARIETVKKTGIA